MTALIIELLWGLNVIMSSAWAGDKWETPKQVERWCLLVEEGIEEADGSWVTDSGLERKMS